MLEIPVNLRAIVKRRVKEEYFAWLTTVGTDLSPQPRPVWFIWESKQLSFLIYSQPHGRKIHHLLQHPNVAVHFNADAVGDNDVLVFIGKAEIATDVPPAHKMRAYMNKYREGIAGLKMTPEEFAGDYSVAIRMTPTTVRGW